MSDGGRPAKGAGARDSGDGAVGGAVAVHLSPLLSGFSDVCGDSRCRRARSSNGFPVPRRAARAAAGAEGGELHIVTLHALAVGVLPPVFARWRAEFPGVALRLHECTTTDELRERMERGVADLAVGPRPENWPGPVVSLGDEEIVLVVSAGDPLAGRAAPVALEELVGRAWVRCALEPVVGGRRWLDVVCEERGFAPVTAVETEHSSTAVRMAAAGLGIVAAPRHLAETTAGAVAVAVDPPWRREQTVFSRVEPTGVAEAFVARCAGILRGPGDRAPDGPREASGAAGRLGA
ncbi:LysR family transcriptional regulator substrate-binding protein [Streptomyces abikoensis]|uniref:LysR family transcriptional regulator substrate-binding protein n=1 Tax=Streptomyces abikoensis TaxID=97398 RepID=UPI003715AF31